MAGASGWGGWGGWGGNGGGGTDALVTDALMRSRDGTVLQDIQPLAAPMYPQPPVGSVASMHRWEPLLRFNVALFDLLSELRFETDTATSSARVVVGTKSKTLIAMHRPSEPFFQKQFALVKSYAEIRGDRTPEIIAQMHPQVPFWSAAVHMHPSHTPKTLELVELALGFASVMCMRFKQAMSVARPIDWSAEIQPIIATPSHSAYPSGHATEAYMIAYTLPSLVAEVGDNREHIQRQLLAQAYRIAENRTVAGVHFPVDSLAGQALAKALADYFLFHCGKVTRVFPQTVNPIDAVASEDFTSLSFAANTKGALPGLAAVDHTPLKWIVKAADEEWR